MSDVSNLATHADAHGCGAVLRDAREKAGRGIEEVSRALKMPVHIVEAIESEQWNRLGAPVYVRGQLRSYARLLGVDLQPLLAQAHLAPVEPVALVSHTHTPRYRLLFDNIARRMVYVAITAMVAVPVWYWMRSSAPSPVSTTASLDEIPSVDAQALAAVSASSPATAAQPGADAQPPVADKAPAPYVASMGGGPRTQEAAKDALVLRFTADSWVKVSGPEGQVLEQGLMHAGDERRYAPGQAGKVLLGNATAVEVQQAGTTLDLAPFRRANVARFTVSSDGSVVPVSD